MWRRTITYLYPPRDIDIQKKSSTLAMNERDGNSVASTIKLEKPKIKTQTYNSVTAYSCRSLSLLAYIASLCVWSWILADLNCECDGCDEIPLCRDLNCTLGWKVLTLSCHAPLCSDLKLAGLRGVSMLVVGTLGTGGCLRAFSSGV
ncbi:hypothetical protein NQ318_014069 [Aromia moschata]|uniref:Uncharacterized protein n=1 Tax=Aromia moschata TaxID=1265417 RepID=A0AAV8YZD4_9CUCU|nr:hypothetical protein NQ318_014069 [Aromia moschata]